MKKVLLALVLFSLLLGLCGCAIKQVTVEQSEKNFDTYQAALQSVAAKYDVELVKISDDHSEDTSTHREFCITLGEESEIVIYLYNSAYQSNKGVENFDITYTLQNADSEKGFSVELFTDLANCLSGKPLSTKLCNKFLSAPEADYAAEYYGYPKSDDDLVAKQHPLNFWEDWTLFYNSTTQNEQTLAFGGRTKS